MLPISVTFNSRVEVSPTSPFGPLEADLSCVPATRVVDFEVIAIQDGHRFRFHGTGMTLSVDRSPARAEDELVARIVEAAWQLHKLPPPLPTEDA